MVETTPLVDALSVWRTFNLEEQRGELDAQGLAIAENQQQSQKSRRGLAERTRDFKKSPDEEKNNLFGPLLKAYQVEIDALTKRAKFSEGAFVRLYQALYEAPDPAVALAMGLDCAEQLQESMEQQSKMKTELDEYRAEAATLKNQRATLAQLQKKNRSLEQSVEDLETENSALRKSKESQVAEDQRHFESMKEREEVVLSQVEEARQAVKTLTKEKDAAQNALFELRAELDTVQAAKQSECDLLNEELERSQSRVASLERSLAASNKGSQHSGVDDGLAMSDLDKSSLKGEVEQLRSENAGLECALQTKGEELDRVQQAHAKIVEQSNSQTLEITSLREALGKSEEGMAALQSELDQRPSQRDLAKLEEKVRTLQMVGNVSDTELMITEGSETQEAVFQMKVRKLEHDLTLARVALDERDKEVKSIKAQLEENVQKRAHYEQLAAQLDEQLARSSSVGDSLKIDEVLHVKSAPGLEQQESSEGPESVLQVICGQRDRFRKRMLDMEDLNNKLKQQVTATEKALAETKKDNSIMYERLRYVETYRQGLRKNKQADIEEAVIQKYRTQYEESINPFKEFHESERRLKMKELGFRDRITLSSGRFILGNKYGRTFIFFYSIALHLLVFGTLYYMSHEKLSKIGEAEQLESQRHVEQLFSNEGHLHTL